MKQKFQKISSKSMRWNWMRKILHAYQRLKQNHKEENLFGSSPRIVPIERRNWIDIKPGKHSLSAYEISKKASHLFRHSQQVHREDVGAVHFWRIKKYLQSQFPQIPYWSDDRWKKSLEAGGGAKRRYLYCTHFRNSCLSPSSSRTFRTQSYW